MKNWVVLLIFCFCFALLPAFAQQKSNASIDSVLVSPQLIKVDSSKDTHAVKTSFEIINNSSHEICIESIRPSCSCVSLTYDNKIIAAGEKRKVLVGLNNTNPANHYIYTTVLDKSDNKGRTILIKIPARHNDTVGTQSNKVTISPSVLEFSNVSADYTAEAIIEIKNQGKKAIFIRNIFEPCSCISVEYDKNLIKPNETKRIKVKHINNGESEPTEFDLMIYLNNTSRPYIVKIVI